MFPSGRIQIKPTIVVIMGNRSSKWCYQKYVEEVYRTAETKSDYLLGQYLAERGVNDGRGSRSVLVDT